MESIKLHQLIARGQVQQVGYRAYAKQRADIYHLEGKVKNLEDGTVEIFVKDSVYLKDFIHDLERYPDKSKLTTIENKGLVDFKLGYSGFLIDR